MEKFQKLFAASAQGIIVTNHRDEITHWNLMAESIFGLSSRAATGCTLTKILRSQAPDIVEQWESSAGNDLSLQSKVIDTSGETHLVEFILAATEVDAQGGAYRIVIANDISHQWLREEQLQRAVSQQSVMNTILHVAMLDRPFQEQLQIILELILAICSLKILPLGAILVAEKDPLQLHLKAHKGLTEAHLEVCRVVRPGDCCCGRAAAEEEVVYEGNCIATPELAETPCRKLYPGAAQYSIPIRSENRVLGVLVLFLARPLSGPQPALETMLAVTNVLAAVLEKEEMRREQDELVCYLRSANKNLRNEKKFSESVIASLLNGLLVVDNEGRVLACNPEGRRLLGQFFAEDLVGRRISQIFGGDLAELLLAPARDGLVAAPTRRSVRFTTASGQVRLLEYVNFPLLDGAGVREGSIISLSDITEADRLLRKMEKLDRFSTIAEIASAVAHEVRNPLAGIKAISQVVESQLPPDDKNQEHIGRIIGQVDRLNGLLNDFFAYARPPKPVKKPTCIKEIVDKVVPLLQSRAWKSAIVIDSRLGSDLPSVVVDSGQIQQVLLNILLNGLDAIKAQGTIAISAEYIGLERTVYNERRFPGLPGEVPYLLVLIRDSGEGMASEVQKKIFEPFFTTKSTGTGLGLAIVMRIIREHKAALYVESGRQQGTTFFIFFRKE